jgi:hypothetical protein
MNITPLSWHSLCRLLLHGGHLVTCHLSQICIRAQNPQPFQVAVLIVFLSHQTLRVF